VQAQGPVPLEVVLDQTWCLSFMTADRTEYNRSDVHTKIETLPSLFNRVLAVRLAREDAVEERVLKRSLKRKLFFFG
jgi:hypothetical protein